MPNEQRFWDKVDTSGECWLWLAGKSGNGYGSFSFEGRSVLAHRHSYEMAIGPIPDDLTIDHLCRNRACVNPNHLEPVTNRENILRGLGAAAQCARQTHCLRGHPYDLFNTYRIAGRRHCKTCDNARARHKRAILRLVPQADA